MSRPEKLIGVLGKAGHGKDAVARVLVENHGYVRRAFADALKEDVGLMMLRWCEHQPHAPRAARQFAEDHKAMPEVRTLLQSYGAAMRQIQGEDYWIERLFNREWPLRRCLVIPDVRYPNEWQAIKERGGTLIRVVRPGYDHGLTPEQQAHPSETALDLYKADYIITNDADLPMLSRVVQQLLFNVL